MVVKVGGWHGSPQGGNTHSMAYAFKIMIIDDSTTECLYMSQTLKQAGYQVSYVMNGREGLRQVMAERPHCLILDVVLPEMNGYEICRYLRTQAAFKQLPIIMVSTKRTSVDTIWALRQGASRYLSKPFAQEALLSVVQELLSARQLSPEPPVTPRVSSSQSIPVDRTTTDHLLQSLIPVRIQERDPLRGNYAQLTLNADRLIRRVYNMIDGRTNIERLYMMTHLSPEQMRGALRLLVEQRRIQLFTPAGQKVDAMLFLGDD
jgi:DNA-binding response OmpR family regulator